MKVTFLHLSDLHFRADWPEQIGIVYSKFLEDLKEEIKKYEQPYLVFSGDFVQAAIDEQSYHEFLKTIIEPLEEIGIPKNRRISVPGNHDVCRAAIKDKVLSLKGALGALSDEESFLNELASLNASYFSKKFSPYIGAEKAVGEVLCCGNNLGGEGWDLPGGLGIYCLNTSLCSFGGLENPKTGEKINDKELLSIDTRSLFQWIQQTSSTNRVLVMHHPLDWLSEWARTQLESIIVESFDLVLFGHFHKGVSNLYSQGTKGSVFSMAPPLFTRKSESLGYSFVTLDTEQKSVEIAYRQWVDTHKFVLGTSLARNDSGKKLFMLQESAEVTTPVQKVKSVDTEAILEAEFIEASTCVSSKRQIWVDRDICRHPETISVSDSETLLPPQSLIEEPRSSVIRAPQGFGLTCYGRFLALSYYRASENSKLMLVCVTSEIEAHRQGVIAYLKARCHDLKVDISQLGAIILDGWKNDQKPNKILRILRSEYAEIPLIVLQAFDDFHDIHNATVLTEAEGFEILYLRSLTRGRIRELSRAYFEESSVSIDEDLVTNKLISDIDALNMHRTPLNCLLLLKLMERAFDDSPVNRTQMIGNVLFTLFQGFDKIPTYSARPDLKDCEFALGFFCEWIIRERRKSFLKDEFTSKILGYCRERLVEIDGDLLFNFLWTENILIRRGIEFAFRHTYWLFYFAAQRMHRNSDFANFILSETRYTAFPEIIEFYTGIDRMRTDAVTTLTVDLQKMDNDFLERTGISDDLNPFAEALWQPTTEAAEKMRQEVADSVQESSLPNQVKDAVADGSYNRAQPYHQEIANFITESSLNQMIRAMKGAARALRNSDYVDPAAKADLLKAVITCWVRMCQILVLLSPVLATNRRAQFEGMGFFLDESFKHVTEAGEVWKCVMSAITDNVVSWFQLDIFSKKLAPLFKNYLSEEAGDIGELLILTMLIQQRPPGWNKVLESFIVEAPKNSFYLYKVYQTLRHEFKLGYSNEQSRQQIRTLAAMSAAKHGTGVKHPNKRLIEEAGEILDKNIADELAGQ